MNVRLVAALLAALTLGQGCIINNYHGGRDGGPGQLAPGNVTFFWTFQGASCAETSSVASVRITIPNERLQNDGVYSCLNGGFAGITLHEFVGGTYEYTLEGLSNTGAAIFRATGTFAINGDVRLNVDLTPSGQQTSFAYLSWSFPANWASQTPSCAEATVRFVDVQFNQGEWVRYDCAAGMTGSGARSPLLPPGTHTIKLVAVYVEGTSEYAVGFREATVTTTAHAPTNQSFTLPWQIGGTTIAWQLKDGTNNVTCAQAQVERVAVHFRDVRTGKYVYGNTGDSHPCTASTVTYRYLSPGTYEVYISARSTTSVAYLSRDVNPPRVTVTAGQWTPNSPAVVTVETPRK